MTAFGSLDAEAAGDGESDVEVADAEADVDADVAGSDVAGSAVVELPEHPAVSRAAAASRTAALARVIRRACHDGLKEI
jgi:hypothetical protein